MGALDPLSRLAKATVPISDESFQIHEVKGLPRISMILNYKHKHVKL